MKKMQTSTRYKKNCRSNRSGIAGPKNAITQIDKFAAGIAEMEIGEESGNISYGCS